MKTKLSSSSTAPLLSLLLGGIAFVTPTPQAAAITDGQLDGENHPYVVMVVAYLDPEGTIPIWRGTGTLISPRVVVTAGHVVGFDPGSGITPAAMQVYFESDVRGTGYPFTGGHLGTPVAHPEWTGDLTPPNTHDIGAVVLDEPVVMDVYGVLPGLGILDVLATERGVQDTTFDIVGYGVQYIRQSPKKIIKLQADPVRYEGVASLVNLNSALVDDHNLFVTSDNGQGNGSGGIAFGDSGGPVFLPGTNVMVGITSFVLNMQAVGPGAAFRTDTPEAHDFILSVLESVGE